MSSQDSSTSSSSASSLSLTAVTADEFIKILKEQMAVLKAYLSEILKVGQLENCSTFLDNIIDLVFNQEKEFSSKLQKVLKGESQEEIDSARGVKKMKFTSGNEAVASLENQLSSENIITSEGNMNQHHVSGSPPVLIKNAFLNQILTQISQLQNYLLQAKGLKKIQMDKSFDLLSRIRDNIVNREAETCFKTDHFARNTLIQIIKSRSQVSKKSKPSFDLVVKDLEPLETSTTPTSAISKGENNDEPVDVKRKLQAVAESSLPATKDYFLTHISSQIDELRDFLTKKKFLSKDQLNKCFDLLRKLRNTIFKREVANSFEIQKQEFLKIQLPKILNK